MSQTRKPRAGNSYERSELELDTEPAPQHP